MEQQTTLDRLKAETKEHRKRTHEAVDRAIRNVLSTKEGQLLVAVLVDQVCGLEAPAGTEKLEGRRSVAIDVDLALVPYPEIRMGVADVKAALRRDDAMYQAALHQIAAATKETR